MVVDLSIAEGTFARAGHCLITFVSFDEVWIESYMTENNIAKVPVGNPVELVLDLYPGRIFEGIVSSITMAASDGTPPGGLPQPPRVDGWMRDPQRFPVAIAMPGYEDGSDRADIRPMLNGQADVIVYAGDGWVLNALGAFYIRLMSVIAYAY